jgi:hypothetical protein
MKMSLVTNGVYVIPSNGITHEGGSPYVLKKQIVKKSRKGFD